MELLEGRIEIDDIETLLDRLEEFRDRHDVTIQAFDAAYVAGDRHLKRARTCADRSIDRGENVARDRAVEILLYAAGRRQIDRALEMGVSEDTDGVVVLIDDPTAEGGTDTERTARAKLSNADWFEPEPTLADTAGTELADERATTLRTFFEITNAELAATEATLEELVCERVVLLEVEK